MLSKFFKISKLKYEHKPVSPQNCRWLMSYVQDLGNILGSPIAHGSQFILVLIVVVQV